MGIFIDDIDRVVVTSAWLLGNFTKNNGNARMKTRKNKKNVWIKTGNFFQYFNSGANLNRYIRFNNKKTKEELFVGGYVNTNNLKVIYRINNKKVFVDLLKKCYENALPVEDDLIGGLILSTNKKTLIKLFINTIADCRSLSKNIVDEIFDLLPSSLNNDELKSEPYSLSHWIQENTSESCYTYKNLKNLKNAEEIFIGIYPGIDEVRIIYRNKVLSPQLLQICFALEIPVEDNLNGGIILNSDNKKILIAFIQAIHSITPISEHVKEEILCLFPYYLREEEFKSTPDATSKWIKEGNFKRSIHTGAELNRTVTYKNVKALKNNEEIFVGSYYGTNKIKVIYRNKNKKELKKVLQHCKDSCFHIEKFFALDDITLFSHDKNQLLSFIQSINLVRQLDKNIIDDFQQIVNEHNNEDNILRKSIDKNNILDGDFYYNFYYKLLFNSLFIQNLEMNIKQCQENKNNSDESQAQPKQKIDNYKTSKNINIRSLFASNLSLYNEVEKEYISEHRHDSSEAQKVYDQKYGLVLRK